MLREPPSHDFGLGLWRGADIDIDAGSGDVVVIPDAAFLFNADFKKAGRDLLIVGDDGRKVVVHDYFAGDKRPALASREGATIAGYVVDAIVKQTSPAEVAQSGQPAGAGTPIGRVEKVAGNAVVIRNGVPVNLNVGDLVYKGDVVQTGSGSSLGIGFVDGSAFNLAANARMVLNEMVYDPNGTGNSALINLVQGSISFLAGQVARTGDMKVETPVATMGIRGTLVLTEVTANNGPTKIWSVFDPTTGRVGEVVALDKRDNTIVLARTNTADNALLFTPGTGFQVTVTQVPVTAADMQAAQAVVQQVVAIQAAFNAQPDLGQPPGPPGPPGPGDPGSPGSPGGSGGGGGGSGGTPDPLPNLAGGTGGGTTTTGSTTGSGGTPFTIPSSLNPTPIVVSGGGGGGGGGGGAADGSGGENAPPVLSPDTAPSHTSTGGGGTGPAQTGGELQFTDPDPADTHQAAVSAGSAQWTKADNSPVGSAIPAATLAALGTALTVTVAEDADGAGTIQWSFALAREATRFLAAGERLVVTYEITVQDAAGGSSTQPVTIVLVGDNDAPVFSAAGQVTGSTEDADTLTIVGQSLFEDADLSDIHAVSAAPNPATPGNLGTLVAGVLHDSTGAGTGGVVGWAYKADEDAVKALAAGEVRTDGFVLTLTDGEGATTTQFVNLTLVGENDAPGVSGPVAGAATEDGGPVVLDALANATDVDHGAALTVVGVPAALPAGVTFDAAAHAFTLNPADPAYQHLAAGETTTVTVDYGVSDGFVTTPASAVWTVTGVNDAPAFAGDGAVEVREGGTVTVTTADLSATDPDNTDAQLVYTLTGTVHGTVLLRLFSTTVSLGVGSTFTQEALAANLVSFQHDGGEADGSFTVSLTDGIAPAQTRTVAVTVNPHVNDAPVLGGDGAITVPEGGTAAVTTADLTATDPDTANAQLVYTVTGLSHGTLVVNGVAAPVGQTFTQGDLAANRVQFHHDGGEADASFTVSLTDGVAPAQTRTVVATVSPHVNDAPAFAGDGAVAVLEGGAATVTTADLSASDPDTPDSVLTYTLTGASHATVLRNGLNLLVGDTFSQEDIAAGRISVQHDGGEADGSFAVSLTDGAAAPQTRVVAVAVTTHVNDAPTLSGDGAVEVREGGTVTVTTADLSATDPDNTDAQLVYTLTGTVHGTVLLRLFSTTVSLGVGSTFTQEALAANLVSFQHDGGEADGSFTVSLTDGTAPAQTRTVVATVNPHVNDPPVLAGDGVVVVQEGGSAVVQTTDLAASDPDTPDSVLTYTLTGASHVTVLRSGLNLLVGDTFLQEDIAAGRITVEHDGGEADGSFTVSLTDGTAPAQTRTVTATVNPHVNDAPVFHGLDGTPATNEGVPVRLDPSVTISDAELDLRNGGAGNYAGASLVIARHNDPGMHQHDTFGFDTAGALFTVVGNELRAGGLTFATFTAPTGPVAGTGILTIAFTGAQTAATTALVNDVVQRILYANTNDNPPANPRLDYLFDDGGGQGLGGHQTAQGHVFVTITPVNDAPVNTVPGAQSVAEDTGLVFSAANGNAVTVADPDIGAGGATVTLSVLHGTLTLGSVAGLTALSGDGTGTVTLTGTLGDINAALSGLTYQGNPNFNGADTLKVETSDNGNSGTGGTLTDTDTVAITVTAVNDAPGIGFTPVINLIQNGSFESPALPSGGFIFGATGTTITNWFVSQGDVDLITSWQSAEGNQSLELNGFQRGAIQQSFATTVGQSYTVRFSLAGNPDPGNANDFVHDLRVSATGASPQTYVFDSTSHTASSMGWTNEFFTFVATATTTTVTFESLDTGNSGPALDGVSVVLAFAIPVTEDTATRLSGITISEDDSGTADITVTYAIPAGSGTLSASAGGGVEVDGSGTRTLTLTGTIAEIQAYLNDLSLGVTYTPAQDRDTDTTLTVTVNDNGATGAGGPQIVSRDFTLDLVPADEAPTNNAPTITASAPPTLLFGEIADGIEESAATDAFVGFGDVYWLSTGHNSTSVGYQDEYGDFTLIHSVSGTLGFNFKAGHLYALGGFSTTSALGDVLFVAGDSFLYDNATDDASPSRKAMFAVYPTNGSGTGGPAYTPPGETFPSIPPAFTYNTREFFAADGDEGFRGIATDAASGHVYAVGFGDAGSGSSLLVAEYDTTGQLLHWAVDPRIVADDGLPVGDYSGSEQSSVANDAGWFDGHLWVFGAYDSGSGYRPSVWEYDADLNIQQQLLPPDGGEFLGATVAGGFLYAVGDTTDASDGQDALIVKYDAAGVPVWTTTFDGDGTDSNSGGDAFDDIVATEDGRLFAVGYTTNALGRFGVTLEIDPATGDVLTRTNSGVGYDRNTAVATDGTNLYVTETEEPDGPSGGLFLTYAIDPTVVEDGVAANGDFRGLYFVTVQLTIGDSDGDPVRYVTDGWTPVEPDGEGPWTSLFNANGHHYAVIYNNGLTWDEAEAGAEGLGGYLATITDADENTFIKNLLDGGSFYIGGSDPDLNGSWHWATGPEAGEEFWDHGPVGDAYANWDLDAGEPTGDFEPFALIRGDGFWNDGDGDPESDGVDGYVIEFSRFSLEGIYGRLELDTATGEATYVLDDFDPDTQALREGDIVTDHFEIVVADSHGAQTTLPLDFTVIGSNDPADAQELKVVRFADDLTAPFALDLAAPVDPDDGPGTLHVFIDELPTHGTIRLASGAPLSPGQEITVAELTGLLFDPADDATGGAYAAKEMFFRYTVWDGHGANFLGDQATVVLEQISTTTPAAQGTLPFSESSSTSMSSAYHPIADEFAGFDTGGLSLSGTGYAYGSFFGGDGTFMATDGAEFAVSSLMVAGFNGATAIRVTAYDFDDLVWQGDYDVTSGGPFVLVEPDADGASTGPITQLRIRPLAGGFSYGQLKVDDVSFSTVSSYVGAYSDDLLTGGALADRLHGLNGDDTMTGGAGDDLLAGGYGQDVMDGGAGADTYRFAWIDESGPTAETADLILGFTSGQDKIDLSAIDADVTTTFNDDFEWGDQNPNAVANSVTWFQDAAHNRTVIQMDNNGDAIADMMIVIAGLKTLQHDDFYGLNGL